MTLSPDWEMFVLDHLSNSGEEKQINFSPSKMNEFVSRVKFCLDSASKQGEVPVILVSRSIRLPMRRIIERIQPSISVLAQEEIFPRVKVRTIGSI